MGKRAGRAVVLAVLFAASTAVSVIGCGGLRRAVDMGGQAMGDGRDRQAQDGESQDRQGRDGQGQDGNGQGPGGQGQDEQSRDGQALAEEQILRLPLDAEVSTLDPQAAVDSTSFEVIACMMEGLYGVDEGGEVCPALAEETVSLPGGEGYRFTLRKALWSDGSPVTAEDFVYGWQRGIDPGEGNENGLLFKAAGILHAEEILAGKLGPEELGIRAVDERTLEVVLERPVPYFLSMLAMPVFYPMDQAFFEGCEEQYGKPYGTSPETVLANGPFCLESYQPSAQEIFLVRNPDYWQAGEVRLEAIAYQVVKDTQQALMAYERGELDMAILSGEQAEQYADHGEGVTLPLGSLWYLSPNINVPGLENESLRKAISLAYDRETAVGLVLKDGSRAAYGAVPSGFVKGPDGRDFRDSQREPDGQGDQDSRKGRGEGVKSRDLGEARQDRPEGTDDQEEAARRYLAQAKRELGREDFVFSLMVEDTTAARELGQFLQAEIQTTLPGVTIDLEPVPKKMRLERMGQGEFELGLARWGADYSDPVAFLGMWTADSPFNYGNWSDSTYDRMLRAAGTEPLCGDPEARWDLLHQAEEILLEQAAIFPVCEKAVRALVKSDVQGAVFQAVGVNRVWKYAWKGTLDRP